MPPSRRPPQPLKGLCRLSRLATGGYRLGALYKARKREEGRRTAAAQGVICCFTESLLGSQGGRRARPHKILKGLYGRFHYLKVGYHCCGIAGVFNLQAAFALPAGNIAERSVDVCQELCIPHVVFGPLVGIRNPCLSPDVKILGLGDERTGGSG